MVLRKSEQFKQLLRMSLVTGIDFFCKVLVFCRDPTYVTICKWYFNLNTLKTLLTIFVRLFKYWRDPIPIKYIKEKNFRLNLFSRVILFNMLRGSNLVNWLPVDFSQRYIFASLSLYILIFSWFFLQLVVCESRNSHPKFSIFQLVLFGYNRLNSQWFHVM